MIENKKVTGALVIILFVALGLRLLYFSGMVRGDDFNYAHAAYALSQGNTDFGGWVGTSRVGLYVPVAILYTLFGPSESATLAFPILSSLLSLVLIFCLARMFGGSAAGLIAALIWAFMPLDVHLATTLLPDAPLAAASSGAVYFLFLAEKSIEKNRRYYVISGMLLLWAVLIKPLAIITVIFFGFYGLWKVLPKKFSGLSQRLSKLIPEWKSPFLYITIGTFLLLGVYYAQIQPRPFIISLARTANNLGDFLVTGASELDFSDIRFAEADLLIYIVPLFLVAITVLISEKISEIRPLLLWLGVIYFYYEWGTINLKPWIYESM